MQKVPGRVSGRVAAAHAPAAVLRRPPGGPRRVPHRAAGLRVQDVRRRPVQILAGTPSTLRQRATPQGYKRGRYRSERRFNARAHSHGSSAALRVAAQPRDGGRRQPDHAAGGPGGARVRAGVELGRVLPARRAQAPVPGASGRGALKLDRRKRVHTRPARSMPTFFLTETAPGNADHSSSLKSLVPTGAAYGRRFVRRFYVVKELRFVSGSQMFINFKINKNNERSIYLHAYYRL